MDFKGQKAAEQLCLYIILISGVLAFGVGWLDANFALMMKVRTACSHFGLYGRQHIAASINTVRLENGRHVRHQGHLAI